MLILFFDIPEILINNQFLATAAFAARQSGYEDGKEYVYQIESQTLVSLNFETKHTSGIFIEARLTLQLDGSKKIRGKITQPRYVQIHSQLDNGVDTEINPKKLDFVDFPISDQPFDIEVEHGIIKNLIVDAGLINWELNFLKSIIGQLQVGDFDEHATSSGGNNFPEDGKSDSTFQMMEDAITGRCEVLYNFSTILESELDDISKVIPMPQLKKGSNIISIEKTKNYSNCEQRVGYHFNINGRNKFEPGSNENGKFLSRSAKNRIVISGGLKNYIVQSSVTTNRVTINPDQEGNQGGMLVSKIKLILDKVKEITDRFQPLGNPVTTGNLIYDTGNPLKNVRPRCSHNLDRTNRSEQDPSGLNDSCSKLFYPRPNLSEAPKDSKIPYKLKSARSSSETLEKVDIVRVVKEIVQSIKNELSRSSPGLDEQTLEKFSTLIQLIRSMSAEEIFQVQQKIFELSKSQESGKNLWIIFRDAVAHAGTGPALISVKNMIDDKQIRAEEAAFVVDTVAKSARTPTPEYIETYFGIAKSSKVKKDFAIHNAAIISFAELTRHAIVNENSAKNRYPVDSYGPFFEPIDRNVMENYTNYISQELSKSVDQADSRQILVYIQALGRTADPRIINIFEPYLKGEKNLTPFQRLSIVLALDKFAEVKHKIAQPFLYALYTNYSLPCEVRTALVYMLMKTKPSANMLQSMANNTNNDDCRQVNSAVKSSIESLAKMQSHERGNLVDAAKTAVPFLKSESYGILKSKSAFKDEKDSKTHTGSSIMAYDIEDLESGFPKEATLLLNPTFEGLKLTKIKLESAVSSPRKFMDRIMEIISDVKNEILLNQTATVMGDQNEKAKDLEGYALIDYLPRNFFWAFDDDSLKNQITEYIRKMWMSLENGESTEGAKFTNYEVTLKFPTETGFPVTFRLEAPKFIRVRLNTSANQEPNNDAKILKTDLDILYMSKFQKRLSFDTFFDQQEYVTGVDKNLQLRVPLCVSLQYDLEKKQTKIVVQPIIEDQDYDIIQFKKQPFSTKRDLLDFGPINRDEKNHITDKHFVESSEFDLKGEGQQPYLHFKWNIQTDKDVVEESKQEFDDRKVEAARNLFKSVVAMVYPREFQKLRFEEYYIRLHSKINVSAEFAIVSDSLNDDSNNSGNESVNSSASTVPTPFSDMRLSKKERKQQMFIKTTHDIEATMANFVDVSFRLSNGALLSFNATTAFARNKVQKKSQASFYVSAKTFDGGDYYLSGDAKVKDLGFEQRKSEEAGKNNTQYEYDVEIESGIIGNDERDGQKFTMHGEL
ncbi:hypothetical protein QAD02_015716 [Eretmocerus hayati]|uniref:Uncharacterized protein n=1 Tax=Eretmocerus hayati TaxID=131215 RepID=A0ACC2P8J4_9HYME|nr:hypothetical protein QAD02_015716 [Eretmocerus hayati]